MRYIKAHIFSTEDLKRDTVVRRVGLAIRNFHNSNVTLPKQRTQLDRARKHYDRANSKGIAFPSIFQNLYEEFIREGNDFPEKEVLCHGDLNPANILIEKEHPYFIDWAGATIDNPYTDLGYASLLSGMDSEQAMTFLEGYFDRDVTESERKKLALAQARICFLTAVVWFDFSETITERQRPLQERIKRLDRLLVSEDLKTAQEYILAGETVDPSTAPAKEIQLFALGFLKEYLLRKERLNHGD